MTRTISDADIAALVAVRSVIADAAHHPGRQAAIEAIDRLQQAPGCAECEKRKQADDKFMSLMFDVGAKKADAHGDLIEAEAVRSAAERLRAEFGPSEAAWAPTCTACGHSGEPSYRRGYIPLCSDCGADFREAGSTTNSGPTHEECLRKFDETSERGTFGKTPIVLDALGDEVIQQFMWKADPVSGGVLSSKGSRLAVGINRDGNNVIAFPLNPAAGKRREVTRLDVTVTYVDRDAPATQRFVRHQLFDAKCEPAVCICGHVATYTGGTPWCGSAQCEADIQRKLASEARAAGDLQTASLRGVVGQGCHVCGALLLNGKSVRMNVTGVAGDVCTITTCGDQECRQAVERTNRMAPESAVTEKAVILAGVRHVGGQCCQESKCGRCGGVLHTQTFFEPSEIACEGCHAWKFK